MATGDTRIEKDRRLSRIVQFDPKAKTMLGFLVGLAVLAVLVFVITGVNFFSPGNLRVISRLVAILGVAALGQTTVIISGGLDLSVGPIITTANTLVATIGARGGAFIPLGVGVALLFGAGIGLVNGIMITKRRVPPFIATLGVAIMIEGGRQMVTQGTPAGAVPESIKVMGTGLTLGVPNLLWLFLVVLVLFYVLFHRSVYGRKLYAVGVNETVGRYVGLRTDWVVIRAYMICGISVALAGVMLAGYTGMADQHVGDGYDLDTIAAAVIGGAAIGGGSGSAFGTVGGVLIMLLLTNLMLLMRFPQQSQMLIKGFVLVLALWLDMLGRRTRD